jgi:hypothetical protein
VTEVGEGDKDPLAEAVVSGNEEEDSQRPLGTRSGGSRPTGDGRYGEAGYGNLQ